jgi:hypothetical protein
MLHVFIWMLHIFHTYVASVFIWMLHMFLFGCCIHFTHMLQVFLFRCCICFTHMLQVFLSECCICFAVAFQVFLGVLASVLDTCFSCFICLQTHVANVSSECFKSRSSVIHVGMWLTCHSHLLQLLGHRACVWAEGWSAARLRVREAKGEVRGVAQACRGTSGLYNFLPSKKHRKLQFR